MGMTSIQAVRTITNSRDNAIVVVTMSTMAAIQDVSPSALNLTCVPMMGGASCLGLGLALGTPGRKVLVLDGDGSLLMQLGSLVTIAKHAPTNFYHFVFNNAIWYYRGGLVPHPGKNVAEFTKLADGAGYRRSWRFEHEADLQTELPSVLNSPGPCLIELEVDVGDVTPWGPENPQGEIPDSQFTRMREEARAMRSALSSGH